MARVSARDENLEPASWPNLADAEARRRLSDLGQRMRLIRLLAARACFRVSTWLAIFGERLAGF